jgi:UDP-GlcNAc:undecaprenyl-phosphate GlcNAc-1-phosphate transferase
MRTFVTAFIIATVVSIFLTPLVRAVALRIGAVSSPGGRHIHVRIVPRLGGIAIFVALMTPLIGLFFVESAVALVIRAQTTQVAGLLIGGGLMGLVGLMDDTRGLRASHKLFAQLAASAVAFHFGFRIDAIAIPGLGDLQMGAFALPITMLWISGVVNAVNLIDGLDGLAAGVVFFAGVTNFVVAQLAGSVFVALIMAAMLGALFGFLFYNYNPARIFMGDSGSYFLGYVLATTSLAGALQKESTAVSLLIPVVALGIPITDTLLTIVRRFVERRPIFAADRGHIHHKLLDLGLTHRRVVLLIHGLSIVLTLAAIGLALGRSWEVGLAILAASAVLVVLIRSAGYFENIVRSPRVVRDRDAERLRKALRKLPLQLAEAESEREIWLALDELLSTAELSYIEVVERGDGAERSIMRRSRTSVTGREQELTTSSYPLELDRPAPCDLRMGWQSEMSTVSPQSDVLLQLLADFVAQALGRLGNQFHPSSEILETKRIRPAGDDAPVPSSAVAAKS